MVTKSEKQNWKDGDLLKNIVKIVQFTEQDIFRIKISIFLNGIILRNVFERVDTTSKVIRTIRGVKLDSEIYSTNKNLSMCAWYLQWLNNLTNALSFCPLFWHNPIMTLLVVLCIILLEFICHFLYWETKAPHKPKRLVDNI